MTLEAWVRPTAVSTAWRTVILKERPGGLSYSLYSDNAASRPSSWLRTGSTDRSVTGTAALPANTWTHLAMTYDGTTIRLYVNGTQVSTTPATGSATVFTNPLRLGGNQIWGEHFAGLMDDVRIYNRTLTPTEIATDRTTPVL